MYQEENGGAANDIQQYDNINYKCLVGVYVNFKK